jgi:molybdopterin-guanine dinucleotide biosynthesis protein B
MKILHIVGLKGHGKTTLTVELVRELRRRGISVGTVKHSGHAHDLDRPGKDSYRHFEAGGEPAAFVTPFGVSVRLDREDGVDPIERIAPLYAGTDLVLVEGYIDRPGPKIEVWRKEKGQAPLTGREPEILAVITDDEVEVEVPVWPRSDVGAAVDRILEFTGFRPRT